MTLYLLFFLWVWTRYMLARDVERHQHCTFLRSPEATLTHCGPRTSLLRCALLVFLLRFAQFTKGLN